MSTKNTNAAVIATNKQAFRDYFILETVECGVELRGSEVKSIRAGRIAFKESFAKIEGDQVYLYNAHISPYEQASYLNVESTRPRKLLLHRSEIRRLISHLATKGLTLVPLKVYFNSRGFVKVELAVGKGKKLHDRREDIKNREIDRRLRQTIKNRNKR
jgi:SsrA-binding protein